MWLHLLLHFRIQMGSHASAWNSVWGVKLGAGYAITWACLVPSHLSPSVYPLWQHDANQPHPSLRCKDTNWTANEKSAFLQSSSRDNMLHAACRCSAQFSIDIMKSDTWDRASANVTNAFQKSNVTTKSGKDRRQSVARASTHYTHIFLPLLKHVLIMSSCL